METPLSGYSDWYGSRHLTQIGSESVCRILKLEPVGKIFFSDHKTIGIFYHLGFSKRNNAFYIFLVLRVLIQRIRLTLVGRAKDLKLREPALTFSAMAVQLTQKPLLIRTFWKFPSDCYRWLQWRGKPGCQGILLCSCASSLPPSKVCVSPY